MALAVSVTCVACRAREPEFDGENAFRLLEAICAIGPRTPGSDGHEAGRRFITARLRPYTDRVVEDRFTHVLGNGARLELTNIVASFGPARDPGLAVCAHWDTRPRADKDRRPALRATPIIGANDGASGVAVLLEMARSLSRRSPPRRVDLVFFDGEDYGDFSSGRDVLIGSRRYAGRVSRQQIAAAVVIDMVGDRNLQLPAEGTSLRRAPELTRALYEQARRLGFGAIFTTRSRYSVVDDHVPLLDRGIPAADLIDFDYRYWHTTGDTPDKCSSRSLFIVGEVLMAFVRSFDPETLPPAR